MKIKYGKYRLLPVVLAMIMIAGIVVPVPQASNKASASGGLPTASPIIQTLKTNHPSKGHPRIMATEADFNRVRDNIDTDVLAGQLYQQVKTQADVILTKSLPTYSSSLLDISRGVLSDIRKLGLVTQVEDGANKTPYVNKAWAILQAAGNFQDWHPSHFLDTAEMTMAFAIGYDWFYDEWTSTQRSFIRDAIVAKGLQPAKQAYDNGYDANSGGAWWANVTHNWNTVVNGGISNGALAIADESSTIETLAGELLELALEHVQKVLPTFEPDGGGEEGTGYWRYNMDYFANYVSSLQSALGTDYGMTAAPGVAETGYYPIYLAGPRGSFNYGDNYTEVIEEPFFFWLADEFNNDDFAKHRLLQLTRSSSPAAPHELDLLWYPSGISAPYELDLDLDERFEGIDVATMRSAWYDRDALFVGFKGGNNRFNHNHLDQGTFVLHALGERWAVDLGPDDYGLPGYFSNRSNYYRQRTEGHNTIVLNPSAADGQTDNVISHIYQTYSTPERAHMIVDLTDAYSAHAAKVKRGYALIDDRTKFLLQDEVKMKAPGEYYWFMHTQASITLADSGKSAFLSLNGKQLWAHILTDDANLAFEIRDPEPLSSSPNPGGQHANSGKKLTIHGTNISDLQLAVLFVPLPSGTQPPTVLPDVEDLNDWQIGTSQPILYPSADAYVRDGSYANNNYGSVEGIDIKHDDTPNYAREGYMKFDVSDVNAPIVSAKLLLYAKAPNDPSATLGIYQATGSWEENTLTWNNKPSVSTLLDSAVLTNEDEWHELDITSYVQDQQAGSGIVNLGLLQDLDLDKLNIRVSSREQNNKPHLVLELAPINLGPPIDIGPDADAHVRAGTYASTNYGNAKELEIKNDPSANYLREAFMKFDVSSIGGPIASAKLIVHASASGVTNATLGVYRATGSWAENSVTWNTKPTTGTLLNSEPLTDTYEWHEIDITAYVQQQQAEQDVVHLALLQNLDPDNRNIKIHSREESGLQPYLQVRVQQGNPAQAGNNQLSISSGTVTAGNAVMLTAVGDRQSAAGAVPGDQRYVPVSWTSTEAGKSGNFALSNGNYTSSYTPSSAGSYTVTAAYALQEWDGASWDVLQIGGDYKQAGLTVQAIVQLNPAADAYVRGGTYENNNYGSHNALEVKQDNSPSYTREGYMKFNVSSVGGPIVSAKLFVYAVVTDAPNATLGVYRAATDWNEGTVTWATKPSVGTLIQSEDLTDTEQWHEIDITAYVQEQQADQGVVNLALLQNLDTGSHAIRVQSRESSNGNQKPYLQIVHE